MNKLIRNIELLPNQKGLLVMLDNTRSNLWVLRHFRHLTISKMKVCYQINNGLRQRKNTKYPYRWMKKKFGNTADFLDYLDTKSYDIHYIEFDFTNNWNIKEEMNQFLNLTTNSLVERDELIKKLLDVAGINERDKNKLISG